MNEAATSAAANATTAAVSDRVLVYSILESKASFYSLPVPRSPNVRPSYDSDVNDLILASCKRDVRPLTLLHDPQLVNRLISTLKEDPAWKGKDILEHERQEFESLFSPQVE